MFGRDDLHVELCEMTTIKLLNVAGIGLQLLGLILLSRIDLLALRYNEAISNLRDTVFVDVYEAALQGLEHEPSTQELECTHLDTKLQKTNALFRGGLVLTTLGTAMQLLGSILDML